MKISVVVCTYNGEKFIKEQLKSILEQSLKPNEIIICDDKSKDNTVIEAKKILKFYDVPYRIEINKENLGVVKNFEKAIDLTTGDVIFLSDQDDIWNKKKIELTIKEFDKDKSCVMVFSDAKLVNEKREKIGANLWETLNFSIEQFKNNNFLSILLNRCVVTGATMAIKRELFDKTKPFQSFWIHDGWLAINAPLYGSIKAIEKPLIEYRQHNNNVIGAVKQNSFARLKKYLKNIKTLEDTREIRLNRYKIFYEFNFKKLDFKTKNEVLECIKFWTDMVKLKKSRLGNGILIILANLKNKNYKKYYTGLRGAIRDIVYLFFRKVDK